MNTNNIDDILNNYGLEVEQEQIQLSEKEKELIDEEILESISGH
jgi:hypothetical protein